MRVALFGGTFDPPHRGHAAVALAAADAFALDAVLFSPAGRQPLKTLKAGEADATYAQRLAMLSLVCAADRRFFVASLDAPRADGRANYTVDTLETLKKLMPAATIFHLAGADSFLDLRRWYQPDRLLELAEWIVVSRPGFSLADLSGLRLSEAQRVRVHLLETVEEDVSATELRQKLAVGDACDEEIAAPVARFIDGHNLYR